ncbi:MAG: substrate-binding domain-containing protein [Anaerolineae bacterium]|nr:substrate-binding domain-containing protein [Anaerolineae bacterium]
MRKKVALAMFSCAFFAWLILGCAPQPLTVTREPVELQVVTTDACGPLMTTLAEVYTVERAWVTVEVSVYNTTLAEERLREGVADVAALSWVGADAPLWATPFATDAIAIVAYPQVPADGLSQAQLQEIFRGRVGEWSDGVPIQVVSREAGAGTRVVFEAGVMGTFDVTLTAIVMPTDRHVLDYVAQTPGAIGYVSMGRLDAGAHVLALDGIRPTPETTADYPLAYPLYLAASSEPIGDARAFVQWILGEDGQRQVRRLFGPLPTQ